MILMTVLLYVMFCWGYYLLKLHYDMESFLAIAERGNISPNELFVISLFMVLVAPPIIVARFVISLLEHK